jgi:phenylacetate-CoA ligase
MKILEILRNKVFWCLDILKGGSVLKHYNEIKFVLENFESIKAKDIRERRLQKILLHASCSIPFYKDFKGKTNIFDFPIISKVHVRNDYNKFISQDYDAFKKVVTSGSTGTPFIAYQDKNKRRRNTADTIYFANRAGFKFGSELMYIRIWDSFTKKNPILAWIQNVQMHDVINWEMNVESFVTQLMKDNKEKGIIGYASALESLCVHLDKNNIELRNYNICSVIVIAEKLHTHIKQNLERHFGNVVVSRYSNVENGIIAQQNLNGGEEFDINWASYYVEVLKLETDEYALPGELGRVIITDLFNFHMPLIRYDTGDLACMENNSDGIPRLKSIEGRTLDVLYNTNGIIIPSLLIGGLMGKFPEVIQFQLIQEGKTNYLLKLKVDENFVRESELVENYTSIFGIDSTTEVQYYDEIPLLSSGKRRYIINNYKIKQKEGLTVDV